MHKYIFPCSPHQVWHFTFWLSLTFISQSNEERQGVNYDNKAEPFLQDYSIWLLQCKLSTWMTLLKTMVSLIVWSSCLDPCPITWSDHTSDRSRDVINSLPCNENWGWTFWGHVGEPMSNATDVPRSICFSFYLSYNCQCERCLGRIRFKSRFLRFVNPVWKRAHII